MNNQDKIFNLLGLAQKAGKIVSGNDLVINAIKQQSVSLIVIASDSSEPTKKEFQFLSEKYEIPIVLDFDTASLSQAIGKNRKILGIKDAGFSKAIIEKLEKE